MKKFNHELFMIDFSGRAELENKLKTLASDNTRLQSKLAEAGVQVPAADDVYEPVNAREGAGAGSEDLEEYGAMAPNIAETKATEAEDNAATDAELNAAATLIQANFRGHAERKKIAAQPAVESKSAEPTAATTTDEPAAEPAADEPAAQVKTDEPANEVKADEPAAEAKAGPEPAPRGQWCNLGCVTFCPHIFCFVA